MNDAVLTVKASGFGTSSVLLLHDFAFSRNYYNFLR